MYGPITVKTLEERDENGYTERYFEVSNKQEKVRIRNDSNDNIHSCLFFFNSFSHFMQTLPLLVKFSYIMKLDQFAMQYL